MQHLTHSRITRWVDQYMNHSPVSVYSRLRHRWLQRTWVLLCEPFRIILAAFCDWTLWVTSLLQESENYHHLWVDFYMSWNQTSVAVYNALFGSDGVLVPFECGLTPWESRLDAARYWLAQVLDRMSRRLLCVLDYLCGTTAVLRWIEFEAWCAYRRGDGAELAHLTWLHRECRKLRRKRR